MHFIHNNRGEVTKVNITAVGYFTHECPSPHSRALVTVTLCIPIKLFNL